MLWRRTPAGQESVRRSRAKYKATGGRKRDRAKKLTYLATPKGFFTVVRDRARQAGIEFTLSEQEVFDLLAPMRCSITGMELEFRPWRPRYLLKPSLDRIDGKKGYVPGNVQVVALWANMARGNAAIDEIVDVLKKFREMPMFSNDVAG